VLNMDDLGIKLLNYGNVYSLIVPAMFD